MKLLRIARCNFCDGHLEVAEEGHGRICRKCLAEVLAFFMKNNAREPRTQEGVRPSQTSKAS